MQQDIKEICAFNGIVSLKPHVYNFQLKNKSFKILYRIPENTQPNKQKFRSNTTQIQWKPKIPTKKLLQQPKLLLAIERKKIKVINGLEQSQLEMSHTNSNKFRGEKIRIKKSNSIMKKNEGQDQHRPDTYIHNDLTFTGLQSQRPQKTPIINFNLHHLIQKRKTYKMDNISQIQGSNNPYYQYVSSKRFDKCKRKNQSFMITRSKTHIRNRSYENSSSKTVELKLYRQSDQSQQILG